jgi:hypothetical protein
MEEQALKVKGGPYLKAGSPSAILSRREQKPLMKFAGILKAHNRPGWVAAIPTGELNACIVPTLVNDNMGALQAVDPLPTIFGKQMFSFAFDQFWNVWRLHNLIRGGTPRRLNGTKLCLSNDHHDLAARQQ